MHKGIRFGLVVAASVVLLGCPPGPFLKTRNIQSVEVGYVADGSNKKILPSNDAVDKLAIEISEVMQRSGFELEYASTNFGVQPWTGHGKNAMFRLAGNERVQCIVDISKSAIDIQFEEVEVEAETDDFRTSSSDLKIIRDAAFRLKELISEKFPARAIRVSIFDNPPKKD